MATKPLNIHIVDDDHEMIEIMAAVLEARDHKVKKDIAAVYAIPVLREEPPDCLIVDIMMSELNGIEFLAELKRYKELRNTKIIAVSALDDPIWKKKALNGGAAAYLTKPLDIATFAQEIEKIVGGA